MIKDTPNIIKYNNQYWASVQYVHDNTGVSIERITDQSTRSNNNLYQAFLYNGNRYILIDSVPRKEALGNDKFYEMVHVQVWSDNVRRFREDFHHACYYSTKLDNTHWYFYQSGIKIDYDKAREIDQYGNILLEVLDFPFHLYGITKMEFYEQVCLIGAELCPLFKFKNSRSLLNKLKNMPTSKEELKTWLIPGYYGNTNCRKWGRKENKITLSDRVSQFDKHEAIVFYHWINPGKANKLTKAQVYDRYLKECERVGIGPVSLSTVKKYINKKRWFLSLERDGEDTFNSKYSPYIPAEKLKWSGSQWTADYSGSKLGYFDKNGKVKSLNVIRIIDTFSGKIVGWNITEGGESAAATLQAFENAMIDHDKAAFELITDNGGAFTADDLKVRFKRLFKKHRKIQLGNKQANPAENFVRRLTEYSRDLDNWTMLGFSASFRNENSRANEDYAGVGVLNNKAEAIDQIAHLFERWNNEVDRRLKKTRIELHAENAHPDLEDLTFEDRFFAFSNHSNLSVAECRGIVNVQAKGELYKYQFDNFGQALETIEAFTKDAQMKITVAFDEHQAHIYSLSGEYIMPLSTAQLSHKSFAEMTEQSQENFEKHSEHKYNFKSTSKEKNIETEEAYYGLDEIDPLPYLADVKVNKSGKKEQEKRASDRISKIGKTKHEKVEELEEEFDANEYLFNQIIK